MWYKEPRYILESNILALKYMQACLLQQYQVHTKFDTREGVVSNGWWRGEGTVHSQIVQYSPISRMLQTVGQSYSTVYDICKLVILSFLKFFFLINLGRQAKHNKNTVTPKTSGLVRYKQLTYLSQHNKCTSSIIPRAVVKFKKLNMGLTSLFQT